MFGERLRLARNRAGLSMRGLVERMGNEVSAQAISKYESGKMFPSSSVLVALATALGVTFDFLMSSQVVALSNVEFRKHSGTSVAERARAEFIVIDMVERQLSLDAILGLDSEKNELPKVMKIVSSFEMAEELADALRNEWELGSDPHPQCHWVA